MEGAEEKPVRAEAIAVEAVEPELKKTRKRKARPASSLGGGSSPKSSKGRAGGKRAKAGDAAAAGSKEDAKAGDDAEGVPIASPPGPEPKEETVDEDERAVVAGGAPAAEEGPAGGDDVASASMEDVACGAEEGGGVQPEAVAAGKFEATLSIERTEVRDDKLDTVRRTVTIFLARGAPSQKELDEKSRAAMESAMPHLKVRRLVAKARCKFSEDAGRVFLPLGGSSSPKIDADDESEPRGWFVYDYSGLAYPGAGACLLRANGAEGARAEAERFVRETVLPTLRYKPKNLAPYFDRVREITDVFERWVGGEGESGEVVLIEFDENKSE